MDSERFVPGSCSKEFGNPSGHSYSAAMVFIVLYLDLIHGERVTKAENLFKDSNIIAKVGIFLVGFIWATTIPFSRYFLGVHSLDQIIYGT